MLSKPLLALERANRIMPSSYKEFPFEWVDSSGELQRVCFYVYPEGEQQLSLDNFCGVDLNKLFEELKEAHASFQG
jgi:hypothetical protein